MGHVRPVSDFFVTVAETGARKSASETEATWPIRKREQALGETRDAGLPNYVNDKTAWEKARDDAVKRGNGNRATIKDALDALGSAPAPPLEPLMTCPEPTFEGLCKLFAVGQPSLGIFATEGGQFVGGHGMSDDAKLRTAAGLLRTFAAQTEALSREGPAESYRRARARPHRRAGNRWLGEPIWRGEGQCRKPRTTPCT
jgi:hypothetical protein